MYAHIAGDRSVHSVIEGVEGLGGYACLVRIISKVVKKKDDIALKTSDFFL